MNNRPVALIVLLLALGLFFGYVNPTWNEKIAETKAAIQSDNDALAAARAYQAREQDLVQKRDAIDTASLAKLTNFLPDSVDNVGLILALNALAARSGLSLSNIDVSNNTASANDSQDSFSRGPVSPVNSVDLSLTAVGSYTAFQNFLRGIEMSQRLLDVRSLSVTGSNSGLYKYQLTVRLYWLR